MNLGLSQKKNNVSSLALSHIKLALDLGPAILWPCQVDSGLHDDHTWDETLDKDGPGME